MFFLFILFGISHISIIWSKKEKGKRCDLKNMNYNRGNNNFFLTVSNVLALFSQGVSVQGVYVLGGKCPGIKCPGGKCLRAYVVGVNVRGGGVMSQNSLILLVLLDD